MGQYADFDLDKQPEVAERIREYGAGGTFSNNNWLAHQVWGKDWGAMEGAIIAEYNDATTIINEDGSKTYTDQGPYFANKSLGFAKGINVAANGGVLGKDSLLNSWDGAMFGSGTKPPSLDWSPEATHIWLDPNNSSSYIAKMGLYSWQNVSEYWDPARRFWASAFDGDWEGSKKAWRDWRLKVNADYTEQALGWAYCTATNCSARSVEDVYILGEKAHKWAAELLGPEYVSPYEGLRAEDNLEESTLTVPNETYIPKVDAAEASLWTSADESAGAEIIRADLIRCCDVWTGAGWIWGYLQVRLKIKYPSGQVETKIVSDGEKTVLSEPYRDKDGAVNSYIDIDENTTDRTVMYEGLGGWPTQTLLHSETGEPVSLNTGSYNFLKADHIPYSSIYGVRDSAGKSRRYCEVQNLYTA